MLRLVAAIIFFDKFLHKINILIKVMSARQIYSDSRNILF
jgi:hypothetical protein